MDGTFFIQYAGSNGEIDRKLNQNRASEIHRNSSPGRISVSNKIKSLIAGRGDY